MHFDHDFGTITSILAIDTTTSPIMGGSTGLLTIVGAGGVQLPIGTTAERADPAPGVLRYNTTINALECYTSGTWMNISSGASGGGVQQVFVQATQPTVSVPGTPFIWFQTGLGTSGTGMTLWVDDGL